MGRHTLLGHQSFVKAVAYGPRAMLASCGKDRSVLLWNSDSGQPGGTMAQRAARFSEAMAFGQRNRWLVTSDVLWDLRLGGVASSLAVNDLTAYTVDPEARLWVSGDMQGNVYLREVATRRTLRSFRAEKKLIYDLKVGPKLRWLATTSTDSVIHVWDLRTAKQVSTLKWAKGLPSVFGFSPDGKQLASSSYPGSELFLWDIPSGKRARVFKVKGFLQGAVFSPDGKMLATVDAFSTHGRTVTVFDRKTGKVLHRVNDLLDGENWGEAIAFSPDGRALVCGVRDHALRVWSVGDWAEQATLRGHGAEAAAARFTHDGKLLASGSDDGSLIFWDTETWREVVRVTMGRRIGRWLVTTPDGLFDGTSRMLRRTRWRFGGDTFDSAPIEIFFADFFYPGLLRDVMVGRRPKAPRSTASIDRRQPKVALRLVEPKPQKLIRSRDVTLEIDVTEVAADKTHRKGSGARGVRLFRNGTLVKAWRGDVLKGKRRTTLRAKVPIVAYKNEFTAYAFNRDNVKSGDAVLKMQGHFDLKRKGTLHILAIGVNKYDNPAFNLRFAVADARALGDQLRKNQVELARYGDVKYVTLFDKKATKANILARVRSIVKSAQPEDGVVIFFAGHGIAHKERFYLCPHDLGYGGELAGLEKRGLDQLTKHGISDVELERVLAPLDAGKILLVIDACNSGQALEAEEKRRGPMNSKGLAQLAYEKGMNILTAAQGYQAALETAQHGHGLLTYALVEEGLKTKKPDIVRPDGVVTLREWLDYATERVPMLHMEMITATVKGERSIKLAKDVDETALRRRWDVQRPRVFYRREAAAEALIVSSPGR